MRRGVRYCTYGLVALLTIAIVDIVIVKSKDDISFDDEIYRRPGMIALEKYPELSSANIHFLSQGKAKNWAHKAVPRISTLLLPAKFRTYQIWIAEDQYGALDSTLFKNLSSTSQIGVLYHELAHVLDYKDKNSFEMLWFGVKYWYSDEYRVVCERATNCVALDRGLRSEILSWTKEIHSYLVGDGRGHYYHSAQEIIDCSGCD